ncbi:hypothetical protein L1283_005258 [Sphingobacterium sp. HSC-15S19]
MRRQVLKIIKSKGANEIDVSNRKGYFEKMEDAHSRPLKKMSLLTTLICKSRFY